jgi:hypothetical protein
MKINTKDAVIGFLLVVLSVIYSVSVEKKYGYDYNHLRDLPALLLLIVGATWCYRKPIMAKYCQAYRRHMRAKSNTQVMGGERYDIWQGRKAR